MTDKENKCCEESKCCEENKCCEDNTCSCEHTNEHKHENDHDCDCGCGCGCSDDDIEVMQVELEDENGNPILCDIIDGFDYKEKEYAVLVNPEDDSYYIFKVEGDEDEEMGELVVPSEDEFEEVKDYYETLLASEEYNDEEDQEEE